MKLKIFLLLYLKCGSNNNKIKNIIGKFMEELKSFQLLISIIVIIIIGAIKEKNDKIIDQLETIF